MVAIAIKLGPALEARGLTLKDVVEKTSFDLKTLQDIECGKYKTYRLSTIESLSAAIGCEVGELFRKDS